MNEHERAYEDVLRVSKAPNWLSRAPKQTGLLFSFIQRGQEFAEASLMNAVASMVIRANLKSMVTWIDLKKKENRQLYT